MPLADPPYGEYAETLYWGYPWAFAGPEGAELPFVLAVAPSGYVRSGGEALLWADLIEGPVPQQVFATLIPPAVAYTPGQPITGFPTVALLREGQSWRWSAPAQGVTQTGTYTLLYQALYEGGRLSVPRIAYLWIGAGSRHWHLYE